MKFILPLLLILCVPLMADDAAKKRFEETKAKAEKGDRVAQYTVGMMYTRGLGVKENWMEAFKWHHKAAVQGYSYSQNFVGVCLSEGRAVAKNQKEGIKWLRKSAEQGNKAGQRHVGFAYHTGEGVTVDFVTAYAWYKIAISNGSDLAPTYKRIMAKQMTADQIAKAEELIKEMVKKNPKLISD